MGNWHNNSLCLEGNVLIWGLTWGTFNGPGGAQIVQKGTQINILPDKTHAYITIFITTLFSKQ